MDRVITIKEIAIRLNISSSAVSRALNDHKNIGLRTITGERQLAKELNLRPWSVFSPKSSSG